MLVQIFQCLDVEDRTAKDIGGMVAIFHTQVVWMSKLHLGRSLSVLQPSLVIATLDNEHYNEWVNRFQPLRAARGNFCHGRRKVAYHISEYPIDACYYHVGGRWCAVQRGLKIYLLEKPVFVWHSFSVPFSSGIVVKLRRSDRWFFTNGVHTRCVYLCGLW